MDNIKKSFIYEEGDGAPYFTIIGVDNREHTTITVHDLMEYLPSISAATRAYALELLSKSSGLDEVFAVYSKWLKGQHN